MTKFNRSARAARLARRTPRSTAQLSAAVVAAFVSKNPSDPDTISALLGSVQTAFAGLGVAKPVAPVILTPAVPIKQSVTPDYIVCLEDGRKMKSMKRHLRAAFGLTPDEYRAKWGLPTDYPMVAPNYSARRTNLAKEFGLGRKPGARVSAKAPVAVSTAVFLNVAETISTDGIVNLLDGRIVRDLGREVARTGITSDDYRVRFGLPANYPMKVSRAGPFLKALASA